MKPLWDSFDQYSDRALVLLDRESGPWLFYQATIDKLAAKLLRFERLQLQWAHIFVCE